MSELMIFSVPLKPDKKNYEEIKFSDEFKGTPEDMRLIKDSVNKIQNSTESKGSREIQTSIGKVSVRFEPTEGRFKSIEGFVNVEDKAVQKSASDGDDKQNLLYVYDVYLRDGRNFTVEALNYRQEGEKYIFVQSENTLSHETFVLVSEVLSVVRQLRE